MNLKILSESLVDKGILGLRLSVAGGSVGPTMTSTLDPPRLSGADDPAAVLAYARAQKRVEDDAAREVFKAAAAWAVDALGRVAGGAGR